MGKRRQHILFHLMGGGNIIYSKKRSVKKCFRQRRKRKKSKSSLTRFPDGEVGGRGHELAERKPWALFSKGERGCREGKGGGHALKGELRTKGTHHSLSIGGNWGRKEMENRGPLAWSGGKVFKLGKKKKTNRKRPRP